MKVEDKIKGRVVSIASSKVFVEIPGRGMGYIPRNEVYSPRDDFSVGDEIEATVFNPEDDDGYVVLSLYSDLGSRVVSSYGDSRPQKSLPRDKVLSVKVIEANRGGLLVSHGESRGFLPVSQLSPVHYPRVEGGDKEEILKRLKDLVGKEFHVKVIDAKEGTKSSSDLIFSEKAAILEDEKEKLEKLKVGQVIEGEVSGVVDFGIFLHFDNIEGLVHISEISWDRVTDIRKMFKVRDKVRAKIIGIEDGRVSLSLKQLKDDPWTSKVKKYKVGSKVLGTVTKILPFGVFVELPGGIEGLIHISEISKDKSSLPAETFSLGKEINLKIINISPEEHKINLAPVEKRSSVASEKEIKSDFSALTEKQIEILQKAGIKSLTDLSKLKIEDLEKIKGIGKKTAEKILAKIKKQ